MDIKITNEFDIIKYYSVSSDGTEVICPAWIPGYQIRGHKKHWLEITRNLSFEFCEENFEIFNKSLYTKYVNKNFLDILGVSLKLKLYNEGKVYSYEKKLNNHYFSLAFSYYYSRNENVKLFFLHTYFAGEERTYQKDTIFFGCVCQVEFDHEEFMQLYQKG